MGQFESQCLSGLFAQVRQGDVRARSQLFEVLYDRLCRLTATFLKSFPRVQEKREVESVVHDLYIKLEKALSEGHVPSDSASFFRFAGFKLRQLLMDEAAKLRRRGRAASIDHDNAAESGAGFDPASSSVGPVSDAQLAEFHQRVGELPEDQREVVQMHLYLGMPFPEIGELLELHPKKASRLWLKACEVLGDYLPEEFHGNG